MSLPNCPVDNRPCGLVDCREKCDHPSRRAAKPTHEPFIFVFPDGAKHSEDMTREELLAVIAHLALELKETRERHGRELDMVAGLARASRARR